MLKLEEISVSHGKRKILDDISMELHRGDWMMIAGPNGAGKSTLINAITQGVPYTGHTYLDGMDMSRIKPHALARSIGVLSQNHLVSYSFTVEEVVALGRYAHNSNIFSKKSDEDEEMVEQALEMTGMKEQRTQSVMTLSGGELQRVFLAQLFAQNPRILILDEPTNHLDIKYQMQLFAIIEEWIKEKDRAVMSVVHDLSLVGLYGNRVLLLEKGQSMAMGNKKEVLTPEHLNEVYQMDVQAWMSKLYRQWERRGYL